jgi:hypothetical protein
MNDEHEASGDQRRWQQIARQLRDALAARISDVGAMTPGECETLAEALLKARGLAELAAVHGKLIADILTKSYFDQ